MVGTFDFKGLTSNNPDLHLLGRGLIEVRVQSTLARQYGQLEVRAQVYIDRGYSPHELMLVDWGDGRWSVIPAAELDAMTPAERLAWVEGVDERGNSRAVY